MPRPSNKVYVIGKDVFVPHPLLTGLWIRTDLSWPLEFVVHDGEKYYLVEVERDFDPTFSAARPKEIQP